MNWFQTRQFLRKPKLRDICSNPIHLSDSYFQLTPTDYALANYQWNPEFTEQAMFVIAFFWAPTPAIFQRIRSRNPEIIARDDGVTLPLPEGLRLAAHCCTYGAINEFVAANPQLHSRLGDHNDDNFVPSGSYIAVERLTYEFRSPSPPPPSEAPFAAILHTGGERWRMLPSFSNCSAQSWTATPARRQMYS
jgi:hypothetical protein